MDIIMTARVQFQFKLNQHQIEVLKYCSDRHHDQSCRAANRIGGFIYEWNNAIEFEKSEAVFDQAPYLEDVVIVQASVSARFRELDLCAKILEGAQFLNDTNRAIALKLQCDFINAMRQANEKIHRISIKVE